MTCRFQRQKTYFLAFRHSPRARLVLYKARKKVMRKSYGARAGMAHTPFIKKVCESEGEQERWRLAGAPDACFRITFFRAIRTTP